MSKNAILANPIQNRSRKWTQYIYFLSSRTLFPLFIWAIMCLVLGVSIISVINARSDGYESSIFENIPIWSIGATMAISFFSIVFLFTGYASGKRKYLWIAMIIFVNLSFILIPFFKGYYSYGRADVPTNLALVDYIAYFGVVSSENIYPMLHILGAGTHLITGIKIPQLAQILLGALYILEASFILLSARFLLGNRNDIKIYAPIAVSIIFIGYVQFNTRFVTNSISFMMFPMIIFILLRSCQHSSKSDKLMISFLAITASVFHPLTGLVLILTCLAFSGFIRTGIKKFVSVNMLRIDSRHRIAVLAAIGLFLWIGSFYSFSAILIFRTRLFLSGEIGEGVQILGLLDQLNKATSGLLDVFILVILLFGSSIILVVLGLSSARQLFFSKSTFESIPRFSKYLGSRLYISALIIGILFGISLIGNWAFGPIRLLSYIQALCAILGVIPISSFLLQSNSRKRQVLIIAIMMTIFFGAWASAFHSPHNRMPNPQLTVADIEGGGWLYESANASNIIYMVMSEDPNRLIHGALIHEFSSGGYFEFEPIPDHFGYSENQYLYSSITTPSYVLIDTYSIELYTRVWNTMGRYSINDFTYLNQVDQSSMRIFDNGDVRIFECFEL